MAHPVNDRSHDSATATGAGDEASLRAHPYVTVYVLAENLDTGGTTTDSLSIEVEASPTGASETTPETWTTVASATETDFADDPSDGSSPPNQVYTFTISGAYYEYVRTRITAFTDDAGGDLAVTSWVMASGYPGASGQGKPEHGPGP